MNVVAIEQGKIHGITSTNLNGENYLSFLGIPYAKPPVGELRFKAPQPAEPWIEIRECNKDGTPCLTPFVLPNTAPGSEDCLYLHVHTKQLPLQGIPLKPVMVYLHGGAFTMGDGLENGTTGSAFLMMEDIVFVALNYRLGVLGFLSLQDPTLDIPGNAGLKDQQFALKWVQRNISKFNGDPNNVTLFGISAGGAAVNFQLLSPGSKGLFHKAIIQSGAVINPWAWGQKNAILLAENLGVKVQTEKDAVKVLQEASSEALMAAAKIIPDDILNNTIRRPFSPVIEKPNPTAFLTENPLKLLEEGRFTKVPVMTGLTSNEGKLLYLLKMFGHTNNFPANENPIPWFSTLNQKENVEWTERFNNLYYKNGVTNAKILEHLGDILISAGLLRSAKLIAKHQTDPVYIYVFNLESPFDKLPGCEDVEGVNHGADNYYLFPFRFMGKLKEVDDKHKQRIKKVIKMWTDFAKFSIPLPEWPRLESGKDIKYLHIDDDLKLLSEPLGNKQKVWDEFYEKSGSIDWHLNE